MTIRFCDDWLLLPQRLALHEPSATAVLADLHLGYSAVRQRLGDAIPLRRVAEEMQPLLDAARLHVIRQVVVAGDLFERGYDAGTYQEFVDVLTAHGLAFVGLTPGNHDRGVAGTPVPIFPDGYALAGWQVVHGDQETTHAKTVRGHWHPALRRRGGKTPCFLTRGTHLILPAFSLDAAGVHVGNDPRWHDWERMVIDGAEVCAQSRGETPAEP